MIGPPLPMQVAESVAPRLAYIAARYGGYGGYDVGDCRRARSYEVDCVIVIGDAGVRCQRRVRIEARFRPDGSIGIYVQGLRRLVRECALAA